MVTQAELIRLLRSPDNAVVLSAVEQLRIHGWLEDGTLHNVPLCHVHMENANLCNANLAKADLHQAHLQGADMSHANLTGAKLTRVNMAGSILVGTDLRGADLFKANLAGVQGLTDEQLLQAKRLYGATMPDNQTYDGRYNLAGDLDFAHWGRVDINDPKAMADFFGVSLAVYLQGQKLFSAESA
jgi:uncharacterized protein YjbI with pentapeptide repeats